MAAAAAPLTAFQKKIVVGLSLLVAITRFAAVARSLFDWDEGLFILGILDYDVANHHPHPPGYPLFVAAGKLLHAAGLEPFRALQAVVLTGAVFLFPALYFLAREIGFRFETAAAGAAIFCFLPNVWLYGGTAFSDIPATALVYTASALLLRGRSSRSAYVAGAVVLGLAAGIRPTSFVIAAVPALLGTWYRLRARDVATIAGAALAGAVIVGGSYYGAARATGSIDRYREAVEAQSRYVREVDSWRNPLREPLHEVAEDFLLRPVRQQAQMYGLVLLGLIAAGAALRLRRAPPLLLVALFAPYVVFASLTLDVQAAGRYAIAWMAVYALLAAEAFDVLGRGRGTVQAALSAAVIAVFAIWTWPALTLQRTRESPPVAALEWVKRNVRPEVPVYIHGGIGPQSDVILPARRTFWEKPEQIPDETAGWVCDLKPSGGGFNFTWPRTNPIWDILRRRNFEISVVPLTSYVRYGEGWYDEEWKGPSVRRWMGKAASLSLPPLEGEGAVHLHLHVPLDVLAVPPRIEVWMNGAVIDRFEGGRESLEKSWRVASRGDGRPNELRLTTDATASAARLGRPDDGRVFGLRLDLISWTPAD